MTARLIGPSLSALVLGLAALAPWDPAVVVEAVPSQPIVEWEVEVERVEGRVVDVAGQPVRDAIVEGCGAVTRSEADGSFALHTAWDRGCELAAYCPSPVGPARGRRVAWDGGLVLLSAADVAIERDPERLAGIGWEGAACAPGEIGAKRKDEIRVRRRVVPDYPDAAKPLGLEVVDCKVRITIDADGVPAGVEFVSCREEFRESARGAILQWRWWPPHLDPGETRASFLLNVKYKLE